MAGTDALDRPVWASLTSAHAGLALGDARAWRYRPDINVFVAPADDGVEALGAAASLVAPGDKAYVVQRDPVSDLPGLDVILRRQVVQMVFAGPLPEMPADGDAIVPLDAGDAEEMLALATLTEPGPFRIDTRLMGDFVGIRRGGRIAAMAGTRFCFPGHRELSGVCTHPDFGGQGLGTRLSTYVTAAILGRGEIPFLHAWTDNTGAIALYERLGYRIRRKLNVAVFARPASGVSA